jgi:RNA polymerase sigma-70 factor (ECF subfamily)
LLEKIAYDVRTECGGWLAMSDVETELLKKARDGDPDALSALLEQVGGQIRATLDMPIRHQNVLDADDIMQVTYLEAFLRFPSFRGDDPRALVSWLRQIARNNLSDAIRGLEREKRPPAHRRVTAPQTDESCVALCEQLGVVSRTPSRAAALSEARSRVESALKMLPPVYADVIRLFELESLSGPEVAERIGRSRGAAFMLLARARDRMREALGSESRYFSSGGT